MSTSEPVARPTETRAKRSHTPGPWSVEDPIEGELSIVEANKPTHEWKFIATVYLREGNDPDEFPHAVSEANARLIAAAPDLLQAIEDVVESWDSDQYESPLGRKVREAMAKAKGDWR